MNETLKVINSRRSIRSYKSEQISAEEMQAILIAGLYAPSAMNLQKWHFTVVQNKTMLDKLKRLLKAEMLHCGNDFMEKRAQDPDFVAFYDAPTVIILSADEHSGAAPIDCGAAAENMALAAESMNIGSCVMTSSALLFSSAQGEALEQELGIPAGYRHVLAVAFGYKNGEIPAAAPREKDLVNYI